MSAINHPAYLAQCTTASMCSQDWRTVSRNALLVARNYDGVKTAQVCYDQCIAAADITEKFITPLEVGDDDEFEVDLNPPLLDADRFWETFNVYSASEVTFCALKCAYWNLLQLPDNTRVKLAMVLMPRIIRFLLDRSKVSLAEYYAGEWVKFMKEVQHYEGVVDAENETVAMFCAAGAYQAAATRLFSHLRYMRGSIGLFTYFSRNLVLVDLERAAQKWKLILLAMTMPDAKSEQARYYLREGTWNTGVGALSRHAYITHGEAYFSPELLSSYFVDKVYMDVKLLELWVALIIKRDRVRVTELLQNFLSKEDMIERGKGDNYPILDNCERLAQNRLCGDALVDALFEKSPATLHQWLNELGVRLPKLPTTTTVTAMTANTAFVSESPIASCSSAPHSQHELEALGVTARASTDPTLPTPVLPTTSTATPSTIVVQQHEHSLIKVNTIWTGELAIDGKSPCSFLLTIRSVTMGIVKGAMHWSTQHGAGTVKIKGVALGDVFQFVAYELVEGNGDGVNIGTKFIVKVKNEGEACTFEGEVLPTSMITNGHISATRLSQRTIAFMNDAIHTLCVSATTNASLTKTNAPTN